MARLWTLNWEAPEVTMPATASAVGTQQNGHPCNSFSTTADQSIILAGSLPPEFTGTGTLKLRMHAMALATSGVARFDITTEFKTVDVNELMTSDAFGSANAGTLTIDTSGELREFIISLTNHGAAPAAGDAFRLKVLRDGDNSSTQDTLAVVLYVFRYEFYEEI